MIVGICMTVCKYTVPVYRRRIMATRTRTTNDSDDDVSRPSPKRFAKGPPAGSVYDLDVDSDY